MLRSIEMGLVNKVVPVDKLEEEGCSMGEGNFTAQSDGNSSFKICF